MHKLRLQLLQAGIRFLPFGQVPDEAGKETRARRFHLSDGQFHGKGRAILALADNDPPHADDPSLACLEIAPEIAIVIFAVGRRHEHLDVAADHFLCGEAEKSRRRDAERCNRSALVDHDHRFRHRVENRLQMRLARQQAPARLLRPETHRAKRRAHNASGKSDRRDRRHPDDAGKRCRDMRARCPISHSQSGDGRKQPGAKSSENAGRQRGRRDDAVKVVIRLQP